MVWRCCAHAFEHMVFVLDAFCLRALKWILHHLFVRQLAMHVTVLDEICSQFMCSLDFISDVKCTWTTKKNEKQRKDNARCHRKGEIHSNRQWKRTEEKKNANGICRSVSGSGGDHISRWSLKIKHRNINCIIFLFINFFFFHFNYGIVIYSFSQSIQRVLDVRCPGWPAGRPTCVSASEWVSECPCSVRTLELITYAWNGRDIVRDQSIGHATWIHVARSGKRQQR